MNKTFLLHAMQSYNFLEVCYASIHSIFVIAIIKSFYQLELREWLTQATEFFKYGSNLTFFYSNWLLFCKYLKKSKAANFIENQPD